MKKWKQLLKAKLSSQECLELLWKRISKWWTGLDQQCPLDPKCFEPNVRSCSLHRFVNMTWEVLVYKKDNSSSLLSAKFWLQFHVFICTICLMYAGDISMPSIQGSDLGGKEVIETVILESPWQIWCTCTHATNQMCPKMCLPCCVVVSLAHFGTGQGQEYKAKFE